MNTLFRSKNEIAYDLLRQAIIKEEFEPGKRLVIDEIASNFGVSSIPIREALRQLEADGFVEITPYMGATVTKICANSIYEIFAMLEAMEAICSPIACRLMSDADIEILDKLVEKMDDSLDDPESWSTFNKAFHLQICEFAQTKLIIKMLQKVLDQWDRVRIHYMKNVLGLRVKSAQEEHRQIIKAFKDRDADQVERLMRLHNQNALSAYNQYLQSTNQLNGNTVDC